MADIYVKHTGSNTSPYNSWATAATTLQSALAIATTADRVFVSSQHTQSTAGFSGSGGVWTDYFKILSVNDSAQPPTALQAGAIIDVTSGNLLLDYRGAYFYGIKFSSTGTLRIGDGQREGNVTLSNCTIDLKAGTKFVTASNSGITKFLNCLFNFASGAYMDNPKAVLVGGSVVTGSVTPGGFFGGTGGNVSVSGFDFSNLASTLNMHNGNGQDARFVFQNCKLPAAWSGSLNTGVTYQNNQYFEMYNCDSVDTNYRLRIELYGGTIVSETTKVRSGGATDGTTAISWKLASNGNCASNISEIYTPKIAIWNETIGTPVTATVEVLTDGVTLTDAECWVEVQYLGTNGYPLGVFTTDQAAMLATPVAQTTSTATWTTTGITTPVKQKLQVTFTPQEKGFVQAVVKLGKSSTTVYICPKLELS